MLIKYNVNDFLLKIIFVSFKWNFVGVCFSANSGASNTVDIEVHIYVSNKEKKKLMRTTFIPMNFNSGTLCFFC